MKFVLRALYVCNLVTLVLVWSLVDGWDAYQPICLTATLIVLWSLSELSICLWRSVPLGATLALFAGAAVPAPVAYLASEYVLSFIGAQLVAAGAQWVALCLAAALAAVYIGASALCARMLWRRSAAQHSA